MTIGARLKPWVPPAVLRWRRRRAGLVSVFREASGDWTASSGSGGYDSEHILQRVVQATRAVIRGEALFERDSVLFHEPAHSFAVLAALLRAAALNQGVLEVIDFGGSLGSTYRQCRSFLGPLQRLRWQVVEQPSFVRAGAEFENDELSFASDIAELGTFTTAPVVLLSSVLQYIERPREVLEQLTRLPASHLVIDRTPLSDALEDQLAIQQVPQHIYGGSYPCWILSRSRLLATLKPHWDILAEFDCEEGGDMTDNGLAFEFRGPVLLRRA